MPHMRLKHNRNLKSFLALLVLETWVAGKRVYDIEQRTSQ
jgi:hypothetical protein